MASCGLVTFKTIEYIPSDLEDQRQYLKTELGVLPDEFAELVRNTIEDTGDFYHHKRFNCLKPNEKSVAGSKFQDNFKQAYDLPKDYKLMLKFTINNSWTIPPRSSLYSWVLLARGDEKNDICSLELVYVTPSMLPVSRNRDTKFTLYQSKLDYLGPARWIVPPMSFMKNGHK